MQILGGTPPKGLNRAASMSGNREGSASIDLSPIKLVRGGGNNAGPPISGSFTAPKAGLYQFVAWGGGGAPGGGAAGGGGALAIRTVRLTQSQVVPYDISASGGTGSTNATFPDGVMTANRGVNGPTGTGGTATGGDINVSGSNAVGIVGGAAGSFGAFIGGTGPYGSPGNGGSDSTFGAGGLLIITYVGA